MAIDKNLKKKLKKMSKKYNIKYKKLKRFLKDVNWKCDLRDK